MTDKQRKEISKFKQDYKAKHASKKSSIKSRTSASKQKHSLDKRNTSVVAGFSSQGKCAQDETGRYIIIN